LLAGTPTRASDHKDVKARRTERVLIKIEFDLDMRFSIHIITFFFCLTSLGQKTIEEISNDTDIIKFMEFYNEQKNAQWKRISLNYKDKIFLKYTSKEDISIIDSIAKQKWVIADFNKDGKQDLVVACKIYTTYQILGFISIEPKGYSFDSCYYSLINLSTEYSNYYPSGVYMMNDGENILIRLIKYHRSIEKTSLKKGYREDTLTYKISAFVEYNKNEFEPVKFDSIVFRREYVWNHQPPLIKLYSDGKIILFSKEYGFDSDTSDWNRGDFKSSVGQNTINMIQEILGYINFYELSSSYKIIGVSDLPRFKTELYYGGKMKRIEDYGGQGTYGLRLLYKELIRIKVLRQPEIN
jgi:hypothetical protein